MRECILNISEGRSPELISDIAGTACVLDVHRDPHHNRSVVTLAGDPDELWAAVTAVAERAVGRLDLSAHSGAHPRFGVLDVVPWVDLEGGRATELRDRFARWAATTLALPCFLYGPERDLPEVRRRAWRDLAPDHGPAQPHPTAGSVAVGARHVLVAYNVWLPHADATAARRVAAAVRRPGLRTLGLLVGDRAQVSCNLIDPARLGPAAAYDLISAETPVAGAELVGLLPDAVLAAVPEQRWAELDLAADRTIESALRRRPGRGGGDATG